VGSCHSWARTSTAPCRPGIRRWIIVVLGALHTRPKFASVPCSSMMPRDLESRWEHLRLGCLNIRLRVSYLVPWRVEDVICHARRHTSRCLRGGGVLVTILSRELAQHERWPKERLRRHQQERLEALVRHAVEHSPFYRKRLSGALGSVPVELSRCRCSTRCG
jgi:hypothetical protein